MIMIIIIICYIQCVLIIVNDYDNQNYMLHSMCYEVTNMIQSMIHIILKCWNARSLNTGNDCKQGIHTATSFLIRQ